LEKALELLENALATENLSILTVTKGSHEQALSVAARYNVSPNDGVAALLSKNQNMLEVYSFDKHYDNIPFLRRVIE